MSREAFIKLVVVPLMFLAILFGIIWYWTTHRIRIVNDADFPLDDIVLEVKTRAEDATNSVVLHCKIDTLKPGQSKSYFFREDNIAVRLGFKLNGRPHEFKQSANLYTGEIWVIHVDSNRRVSLNRTFFD